MKLITLMATALMLAIGTTTIAFADDEDAGYNTSTGDTVTIGSDPVSGGATPADGEAMQSIEEQTQDMKDRWSGDAQREAVESGTSSDSSAQ